MICPACKATIADRSVTCDFCTARIAYDAYARPQIVFPEIRPGEAVFGLDFRRVALPGESLRERKHDDGDVLRASAEGIVVEAINDTVWPFRQPYLRLRDACVRASCITYGKGLYPRVFLRSSNVKDARIRYDFVVAPEDQTFRIARYCGGKTEGGYAVLQDWTKHAAVAPIGYRNVIEIRALGATLQGWINGAYVTAVHDAVLGIGGVGLANSRYEKNDKAPLATLWEWLEARTVAP
jgi:hypothetical protein